MSQSRLPGAREQGCPTAVPTPGAQPGAAASGTDPRSQWPLDAPVGFSIRVPPRCSSQPLLAGPAKAFGWAGILCALWSLVLVVRVQLVKSLKEKQKKRVA